MKDENGNELSEKEILHSALELLSDACALLFELESPAGIAAAYLADSTIRYTSAIYRGNDPRLSEEFLYEKEYEEQEKNND